MRLWGASGSSWDGVGGMVGGEVAGEGTAPGALGGAGDDVPKARWEPEGRGEPSSAQGAASLHERADVSAAAPGAGPHLQVWYQGLKNSRRIARTCPAGRCRGAFGGSRRKISA